MYHSPQSTTLPKINTCSHCNVIPIWFYTVNNLSLANSYNSLYSAFAPVSVCVPVYVRSPTPIYIEWSGMGEEIADSSTQGEVPLLHLPFNVEKDSTSLTVSFRESVKTKLILFMLILTSKAWVNYQVGRRNVPSYKAIPVYGQPSVTSMGVSVVICAQKRLRSHIVLFWGKI